MTRTGLALATFAACVSVAAAQNVKITPLGSHTGEPCNRDRATVFEDPTGVRILRRAGAARALLDRRKEVPCSDRYSSPA